MKKQNDPKKTRYSKAYKDRKPTYLRHKDILDSIPEHCWWLRQYLRGVYTARDEK